jgi:hypothetical protein
MQNTNPNAYAEIRKYCFLNGVGLFFMLMPLPSFTLETSVPVQVPIGAYFEQAQAYISFAMADDESVQKLVSELTNKGQLELKLT